MRYSLTHLTDGALLRGLATQADQDCGTTALLLAHIAEVDARKLYLAEGHPSMFSYCVHVLHFSEDCAFKRIRAARTARRLPAVFVAVAEGRLHLSAVVMLTSYLTSKNADGLLAAATHRTKSQIEQLLAERFPRPDLPTRVEALVPPPSANLPIAQLAPGPVGAQTDPHGTGLVGEQLAAGPVEAPTTQHDRHAGEQLAPGPVDAPRPKVRPLAPQRFELQLTMPQSLHDKLRYAQELLSHQVPSGDVADVLERALDLLIRQAEKRKFAATESTRPGRRDATAGGRYVPARVKRAVWKRDQGQCTFVSDAGHRCPARRFLEFDHIDEVARGGQATAARMRLRCRAHNQFEAERTFGAEFMRNKREQAQQRAAKVRARVAAAQQLKERAAVAEQAKADVISALRNLGFRADESRRAAALCETIPDASLEERVKLTLSYFRPRKASHAGHTAAKTLGTAA